MLKRFVFFHIVFFFQIVVKACSPRPAPSFLDFLSVASVTNSVGTSGGFGAGRVRAPSNGEGGGESRGSK